MKRCLINCCVFFGFSVTFVSSATPADPTKLRDAEKVDALNVVQNSKEWKSIAHSKSDFPLYFISAQKYGPSADGDEKKEPPLIRVLHYKYDGGMTIRTTIDAVKMKVIEIEQFEAYPTPLATIELRQAIELAKAKSDQVGALYTNGKKKPKVGVRVPVIADRRSQLFGHRVVDLDFMPQTRNQRSLLVEVDLTARAVRIEE